MLVKEVKEHLIHDLIPFWDRLRDDEYGGFYGFVDPDLKLNKDANKGGILSNRILWYYSNCALVLKDPKCLENAAHMYRFIRDYFIDKEYGGVYWSVTRDGKPVDTEKHTYNQAFAIYGLSSYYDASKDPEALELALSLFNIVETKMRDEGGYLEAFCRDFSPFVNEKLSEHGVNASRTMNTLLHLLEAYTELYRVSGNADVKAHMCEMLDIVRDKVYNPELKRQECFFDLEYNSLTDLHSYGHDIEASWLTERSVEILNDPAYTASVTPLLRAIRDSAVRDGFSGEYLYNECAKGVKDKTAVWWVQAETIVAFVNACEKEQDPSWLEKAEKVWEFVKKDLIDKREGSGEWLSETDPDGTDHKRPMVSLWKCPYHNGRMCLELIKRLDK